MLQGSVLAGEQRTTDLSRSTTAPTGGREQHQHASLCPAPCLPILSRTVSAEPAKPRDRTYHLTKLGIACAARATRLALLGMPAILCEVLEAIGHVGADVFRTGRAEQAGSSASRQPARDTVPAHWYLNTSTATFLPITHDASSSSPKNSMRNPRLSQPFRSLASGFRPPNPAGTRDTVFQSPRRSMLIGDVSLPTVTVWCSGISDHVLEAIRKYRRAAMHVVALSLQDSTCTAERIYSSADREASHQSMQLAHWLQKPLIVGSQWGSTASAKYSSKSGGGVGCYFQAEAVPMDWTVSLVSNQPGPDSISRPSEEVVRTPSAGPAFAVTGGSAPEVKLALGARSIANDTDSFEDKETYQVVVRPSYSA
ncbi:hypothetical protein OPT61_g1963 [Boeremia exigua]|uniref:Uncharacterized protein n=1 Tax=Boeremia exigua TaxID=749465 RepID=A0ACC2INA3_9PLEO|nr:hypothetical protein OPT61_g1963 [Boeremia exigua]